MKNTNVIPRINNGEYRGVAVGEIVGYIVDEGRINGKRKRTTFKTEKEAKAYAYKIDVARQTKAADAAGDLGQLMAMRGELLYCWDKLQRQGATFTQAVDYFVKNYKSLKGDITVLDAMELFKKVKREEGNSEKYIRDSLERQHYPRFLLDFPLNHIVNKITAEELRNHFYHKRWKDWNSNTRNGYIRNMSTLFQFLTDRDYLTENRVKKVNRAKVKENEVRFVPTHNVETLLDTAAKYKWYDRIAMNVLVFFCGIRMEEASKLRWCNIDLGQTPRVTVPASAAKLAQRRINDIPPNAVEWLKLCMPENKEHRVDLIIDGNWEDKLSLLRDKASIDYPKNGARHSFGTYHFALYNDPSKTAVIMGHLRGLDMLYKHYRNVVTKEQGEAYFNIVPTDETLAYLNGEISTTINKGHFKPKNV
jgi:integrase